MDQLARIAEQLDQGRAEEVAELTAAAIEAGVPAATILNEGLIAGMNVVGEKSRTHRIFLPHVLLAAKGLKGRVSTVVGGAPVTEDFAREIGADAYAFDGVSAVDRVRQLMPEAGETGS